MTRRATPFRISRRSVLRGTGAALALPWLEVMVPKTARAQAAGGPAPRALFVYFPTGYRNGGWVTRAAGTYPDITLPAIATALTPIKDQITMITGTGNQPASVGNGGDGIHARATGTFLTCEVLQKTGFAIGISADQVIAKTVGTNTCVPSIAMGIPGERLPGFDEDGYGEVYLDNISFVGPRSQVTKDNNPVALFNRLNSCAAVAGGGGGGAPDPLALERVRFETGVMGAVKDEATKLLGCVGRDDKIRLDQFFTSVTELEQRFRTMPPLTGGGGSCVKPATPPASGATYSASIHLMMDMAIFAFQCGLTRVATMMMDGAFSRRNYGIASAGGADYIHGLSHGEIGGKAVDHPRWVAITTHFYENFAYLLTKMKDTSEGERSLLGNSIVYINSEFGDGDAHNQYSLPVIVAGQAGGKYKIGQHIAMPDRTPVANVILTIMQTMGIAKPSFGNSTGTITDLLA
ncbi:MAG TPA: DUF1552 domain-containing protein [Polyangia bacterium]|jgi:hypothetical protein|nr:DUF1552 domain-containing protein [Polyangia bacterium]